MNTTLDPLVTLEHALAVAGGGRKHGSQSALAEVLGVHRATVNGWVRSGMTHLQPLHAHRFVRAFGEQKAAA